MAVFRDGSVIHTDSAQASIILGQAEPSLEAPPPRSDNEEQLLYHECQGEGLLQWGAVAGVAQTIASAEDIAVL